MQFENELLEQAIRRLKPRERYVLFMHAVEGYNYDELAAKLGIGYQGTASVYYRAIEKIRAELRL